jgi:hypothetical protein
MENTTAAQLLAEVAPFEVSIQGTDWHRIVWAQSAGKAKAIYWRDVRESWPDIPFTAARVRKCGESQSLDLHRVAVYREVPFARNGMVVKVGGWYGKIVGPNSSANFDILFVDGPHRGNVLNCHPNWDITYFGELGEVIAEFRSRS